MIPLQRTTLFAGAVFGLVIVVVDTVMAWTTRDATPESPEVGLTFCFNLLLSNIFYSLSGYISGASALNRKQGLVAGLIAASIVGLLGGVAVIFVTRKAESPWQIVATVCFHLLGNVPMGAAFGFLGGNIGARQAK
ncbi:MAG: hypothetical protein M3506_10255 [Chloroflexota bacterium]|nr:hypothetical protein [Chloroflexota bacterium]